MNTTAIKIAIALTATLIFTFIITAAGLVEAHEAIAFAIITIAAETYTLRKKNKETK